MLTSHQQKALDFTKHISLTANAGSGKTFVLSKRFVEIALQEDVKLNNIVAITFTERAAGELYKKISDESENRLEESDENEKQKLMQIRRFLVSANISTIHSFCIDILKEFSPEAGLDANFIPIDQFTANELLSLSIEEFISSKLRSDNSEEIKYLVRVLKSKFNLQRQFQYLIQQRKDLDKIKKSFYESTEEETASIFRRRFEEEFKKIFLPGLRDFIKCVHSVNQTVLLEDPQNEYGLLIDADLTGLNSQEDVIEIIKLCSSIRNSLVTSVGQVRQQKYLKKNSRVQHTEDIRLILEFYEKFKDLNFEEDYDASELELAKFGKILIQNFLEISEIYQRKKTSKGFLDFEDILIYTQRIIDIPEVREHLGNKFKYIMVDEYQDTNEIQYEIFMPILDHLKRGNFFVVGDEKQSIYMFRNAELEIFDRTKSEISSPVNAGNILELPHSFRMSPNIAAFTNYLFGNIFEKANIEFNEVNYSEIICAGKENKKSIVEILLADETDNVIEAELVASRIKELLNDDPGLNPSDIAILCRKRDSFAELESAFIKSEIPYLIIGGKGFYQRQIIYDIKNYLSYLLNNNDDAALVGILRSPFFSVSDLQIFEISLEQGENFFAKLVQYSSKWAEFKQVLHRLNENTEIAARGDFTPLIRKILNETGYWAVISAKINSNQELANLNKLLNLANKYSQDAFKTLYDYVEFLDESILTLDDESQAQVTGEEKAVRIMTIHQSKGLEFKAVFLFNSNSQGRNDKVKTGDVSIDKKFGILTKVPVNENYFAKYSTPPIVGIYNFIQHKKNLAELKRLFYVSVTRAENYLCISASAKDGKANKDTFYSLLNDGIIFNPEDEKININTNLKMLDRSTMNSYETQIELEIPVRKEIADVKTEKDEEEIFQPDEVRVEEIEDRPEGEIISATKISVYNQCPVKYELTYELGYSKLLNIFREKEESPEFNSREDEEINEAADLKGSLIHSVLQNEVKEEELDEKVEEILNKEFFEKSSNLINPESFINDIKQDIYKLYSSEFYMKLKSFPDYKNEFELYTSEGKYFLYGIVDKLIIEDKSVTIVDYKTDNILEKEIEEESKKYIHQLNFYVFIVGKLFPDKKFIQTVLLFIKHPEHPVVNNYNRFDIEKLSKKLNEDISGIHQKKFFPDYSHCSKCQFFEKGKCLKEAAF